MPFNRPNADYIAKSLPNNQRFTLLGNKPPTAQMVDREFNALTDIANTLENQIEGLVVGTLPGVDYIVNNNKFASSVNGALQWDFVRAQNIEPGAVETDKLHDGATTTPKLGNASVTTQKIAQNAVSADQIIDANVTTVKLADANVTTAKIADASITTAKLANQAVTQVQIANAAVGTPQLIDGKVTTAKIANVAVTTQQLADAAVTTPKLAANAVTIAKIGSEASLVNTVLTADGVGKSAFQKLTQESIVDGTISIAKLNAALVKMLPFALLSHDGTNIKSQMGIGSVTVASSGNYRIVFTNAAPSVNYVVTATAVSGSSDLPTTCIVHSLTLNGFTLLTARNGTGLGNFPFMLSVFAL